MSLLKRLFGVGCEHSFGSWMPFKCGGFDGIEEGEYRICSKCGYRESK